MVYSAMACCNNPRKACYLIVRRSDVPLKALLLQRPRIWIWASGSLASDAEVAAPIHRLLYCNIACQALGQPSGT